MPQSSSKSTIARQWELLKLLPRCGPGKTSGELLQQLAERGYKNLSKRTVERDLVALNEVFKDQIHWNAESRPHGWHWSKQAAGSLRGMDVPEAVSLALLEDLLKQLVPTDLAAVMEGRFVEAGKKLGAMSNNAFASWRDMVRYISPGLPFPPPSLVEGVLEAVQEGLLRKQRLKVNYSGIAKPPGERTLDPLALIQRGERSYLVAADANSEGLANLKSFALHRITQIEVLEEKVRGRDGFSLDKYLQSDGDQSETGKEISFRARIHKRLKLHLEESPIAPSQQLSDESGVSYVSATLRDTLQLEFWILSWSFYLEILEPLELRERIRSRLEDVLEPYGRNTGNENQFTK